jgi:Tol biopolymer transport system component
MPIQASPRFLLIALRLSSAAQTTAGESTRSRRSAVNPLRKLAFLANQNTRPNSVVTSSEEPSTFQVRVKDLSTGKEAPISDAERVQFHPQISHDGTLLAYSTRTGIQIFRIDNWPPRTISGMQNGSKVSDWLMDNKRLLIGTYPQANIYVYDAASGRESLLLSKPGYGLFQAKFAPDNRAVALVGCDSQRPGIDCRIFVVPLKSTELLTRTIGSQSITQAVGTISRDGHPMEV